MPDSKHKIEVYCTLKVEGTHNWNDCPYEEVAYLKLPHRHMFGIKAFVEVTHGDRDVEFIMLKHKIYDYMINKYGTDVVDSSSKKEGTLTHSTIRSFVLCEFGSMSCEMIAADLIEEFDLCRCEVNEDEENGAIVSNMRGIQ